MTHLAAYVLGILSALVLLRLLARRVARPPRPFRRSRIAVRQSDYVRLFKQIDDACRQLDELDAARARRRSVPPAGLSDRVIAEINTRLDRLED
jgi:hypothetical protein